MAQQLFGRKQAAAPAPQNDFLEVMRRSRTLEERYAALERRSQIIEENMIAHNRKVASQIRDLNDEIAGVKKSVHDVSEKLQLLIAELSDFARKEDVEVVKKYLNYWDPVKFVTLNQVEKIVKDAIEKKEE